MKKPYYQYLSIATIIILFGFIYFSTLAPGLIQFGDSPKFQFIGLVGGIPHSTGYPLYLLVSKFFLWVTPFQDIAYSINVISALFAIATVVLVSITVTRLTDNILVGFLMAATLALSRIFWSQAIIAEVYTINAFFVILMIWFGLLWHDTGDEKYFYFTWAVACIGLGNHATLIFFVAGLGIYLLMTNMRLLTKRRFWLINIGISMIPLFQYWYLFWLAHQKPLYSEFEGNTFLEFWGFVTGIGFQGRFFGTDFISGFQAYQQTLTAELTIFLVGLAAIGMFMSSTRPKFLLFLILSLILYLTFTVTYTIPDIIVYYIPSYLILIILAGIGFQATIYKITQAFALPQVQTVIQFLLFGLGFLLPVYLYNSNLSLGDWFLEVQNSENLRKQLVEIPAESVIHTPANRDWWRVLYLKYAEGLAEDTQVIKPEADLPQDKAIYVVKPDFDPSRYHSESKHLGQPLLPLLASVDNEDIILLTVRDLDPQLLPPDLATLFRDHSIPAQALNTEWSIILIKKGAYGTFLEIKPKDLSLQIKQGDKISNVSSPINFEAVIEQNIQQITIRLNGQTILKTKDLGLIIVDNTTGKVIESGPINRELLLVNDVVLYKITKR